MAEIPSTQNMSSDGDVSSNSSMSHGYVAPPPWYVGLGGGGDISFEEGSEPDEVPQCEPLTNDQVANSAGGFTWKVDDMKRLLRFLCLGTEGGTYYIGEKTLTLENAQCVVRLAESDDALKALELVVNCSIEGRTAKQNPIIFTLAYFCRQSKNLQLKKAAYDALDKVCRIPTHIFQFIEYSELLGKLAGGSGWGRSQRRAISNWYLKYSENPKHLATYVTKYRSRNGWTHTDVLRLAHPHPKSDTTAAILKFVVKGLKVAAEEYLKEDSGEDMKSIFAYLTGVERVRIAKEGCEVIELIREHELVREHIPTNCLRSVDVWSALLPKMPLTAMIRNLGVMTNVGLLTADRPEVDIVVDKLSDFESLRKARIHPFNVLVAMYTYQKGRGEKGKLAWTANPRIISALDDAFYKCFKLVESTNQRYLLALDVSGSMMQRVLGSAAIMANQAAAAMAMVTSRTESNCEIVGFSHKLVPVPITPEMDLNTVVKVMSAIDMGATNCALPMIWASKKKKKFDVFIVYTDNETWFGDVHPAVALRNYRETMRLPNAKLIVVAMTANEFTIADPNDPGMLDMAGFDAAAPQVINNFTLGLI